MRILEAALPAEIMISVIIMTDGRGQERGVASGLWPISEMRLHRLPSSSLRMVLTKTCPESLRGSCSVLDRIPSVTAWHRMTT
ncbi:hypothetical protein Hthe01_18580 [Hydrogenophilus thermoluteolus]|nr:hypothetical protein Hthe01_18580 [Hydrogenophilus thermoluteolus]